MKRDNRTIEDSLIRFCKGTCSEEEALWIRKEVQESFELQDRVEEIRKIIALEEDISEYRIYDVGNAFLRTRQRIGLIKGKGNLLRFVSRYAAAILAPFMVMSAIFAYLYFSGYNQPVSFAEITTPVGTIMRYELPDQSIVWLNAGSKLRFPSRFATKSREVELWGEGFFEVKANKKRPFYVHTASGLTVYAYGTKFNVNSYDDDGFIETVLESGCVNVISPDAKKTVVLKPGERALFNKARQQLEVEPTRVPDKLAWREGKLVFRNVPLEVVLKKLARHYNVDIELINDTDKKYLYRATFDRESIYQILDYLKLSAPLEWKYTRSEQRDDSSFTRRSIRVQVKSAPE
ncbi:MAG: DUF4974 domain-containing protein [Marinilabiliaceae bacterium]|nr:DUF4974 domain-containing protein [Marinilabiliaceae bacterium]